MSDTAAVLCYLAALGYLVVLAGTLVALLYYKITDVITDNKQRRG